MKKLTHYYTDRIGEAEGFFDDEGNLLTAWSCNNVSWPDEYMDSLLEKLGYKVSHYRAEDEILQKLADYFGQEIDSE